MEEIVVLDEMKEDCVDNSCDDQCNVSDIVGLEGVGHISMYSTPKSKKAEGIFSDFLEKEYLEVYTGDKKLFLRYGSSNITLELLSAYCEKGYEVIDQWKSNNTAVFRFKNESEFTNIVSKAKGIKGLIVRYYRDDHQLILEWTA